MDKSGRNLDRELDNRVDRLRRETRSAWQANNDMANASRNYRIDLPKVKRNPASLAAKVIFLVKLTLWLLLSAGLGAIIALGLMGYKLPLLAFIGFGG